MTSYDSFLEYVATRIMGPAVHNACWCCPFCDSASATLSVRPPKDGYKVKFKCFRCATWGDEFDLMKEFYPGEVYPRRRARLASWRRDYESELEPNADTSYTPRGQIEMSEVEFEQTMAAMLERHVAECDDEWCGNECREARGLPTLTKAEREAGLEEQKKERKARRQRIVKRIKENNRSRWNGSKRG